MLANLLCIILLAATQGGLSESGLRTAADRGLGHTRGAPRFADYPVKTKLRSRQGWLSVGRCDQAFGRAYDRMIRREARGHTARFAGRYLSVVCSCGTGCGELSFVDVKSGRVYSPQVGTLSELTCGSGAPADYSDFLYFRADSSLLITVGDISTFDEKGVERGEGCAIRYYRWAGRRLALLKKAPLH
jgi:hypothetical protein